MSIKPGVAYVRENQSVKYNGNFDLIIDMSVRYTADTETEDFINGLYDGTIKKFKILANSTLFGSAVIDDTWQCQQYGQSKLWYNNNYEFTIYNTTPKTYISRPSVT